MRKFKWILITYALFDFLIGGYCGGFLPLSPAAAAQFTTVTGTVVDPNSIPYAFGTISATLVLPGGTSPTLGGFAYTPPTQPTGLDKNGSFTLQLADNTQLQPGGTQWNFTVCSAVGTVQPAIGKGPVCFSLAAPITISGSSQSISTQLNAVALPLSVSSSSGAGSADPRTSTQILPQNWTGAIPLIPGSRTIAFSTAATVSVQNANCSTTQTITVTINAGSTAVAVVSSQGNPSVPKIVWDDGGNIYKQVILDSGSNIDQLEFWVSPNANAATHVFVINGNGAAQGCIATVLTYTGVVGFGYSTAATATSTTPSLSLITQDPGNFSVCAITWVTNANTLAFTAGTSRVNLAPSATFDGIAIGDNTASGPASVTVAGTITSAFWDEVCLELRSLPGTVGQWGISGPGNQSYLATTSLAGAGAQVLTLQTGATSGMMAGVFNPPNLQPVNSYLNTSFDAIFHVQIPTTTTGEWFVGLSDVISGFGEYGEDFGGFCYSTSKSDTTWNYCTRAGGGTTQRTVSSLSTIDTMWHDVRIRSTPGVPGSWNFSVDYGTETTINTNLPTSPLGIYAGVITRTAASRNFNIIPPYSIISVTK